MKTYVLDFGVEKLGFTFKPWFWLTGCVLVAAVALKRRRAAAAVLTLTASAFLYTAAYFPVIPEAHFRYTHWPAVAVSIALIAAFTEHFRGKSKRPAETADGPLREKTSAL